ncbi:MAG: hypothetical protein XD97_0573, partial [Pelotomaculum thermopropionicum]
LVFLSLAHQNSQLFYTKFNDSPHLIPRVYIILIYIILPGKLLLDQYQFGLT